MAQNYKVLAKQVGPFPQLNDKGKPFVFSIEQFKTLHPVPADQDDAGEYYAYLIDRLLGKDVGAETIPAAIEETTLPAEAKIPVGPHNMKAKPLTAEERAKKAIKDREERAIADEMAFQAQQEKDKGNPAKKSKKEEVAA